MNTYKELYRLIEQKIQQLNFNKQPKELYEPISYMLSLGGKRLRPVLVLMAADLFDGDVNKAIDAALAVEVFHNFTLVHDDIMDNSDIRRGQPTVHKKWDQTVAILSGDLMMIKATDLICETETSSLKKLISIFNKAGAKVCEGQQIDMNFEKRNDVTVDEYIDMITLKTAVLLGCSLNLGAAVANANDSDLENIYEFGKCIGIAFQIQDDILDSFGEGEKVGKKIGGDIAANKKTLLLIKAFELADENTKNELQKLIDSTQINVDEKINAVLDIYEKLTVRTESEKLQQQYLSQAFSHLDKINVAADKKEILRTTANDLMQRMS
ncbi:MAG: polyprenyl synthetase family protein [Bacteroidota bacterium]